MTPDGRFERLRVYSLDPYLRFVAAMDRLTTEGRDAYRNPYDRKHIYVDFFELVSMLNSIEGRMLYPAPTRGEIERCEERLEDLHSYLGLDCYVAPSQEDARLAFVGLRTIIRRRLGIMGYDLSIEVNPSEDSSTAISHMLFWAERLNITVRCNYYTEMVAVPGVTTQEELWLQSHKGWIQEGASSIPISALDFDDEVEEQLYALGFRMVTDIQYRLTRQVLLSLRGVGPATATKIENMLDEAHGIQIH
jgi:hypothetical protein